MLSETTAIFRQLRKSSMKFPGLQKGQVLGLHQKLDNSREQNPPYFFLYKIEIVGPAPSKTPLLDLLPEALGNCNKIVVKVVSVVCHYPVLNNVTKTGDKLIVERNNLCLLNNNHKDSIGGANQFVLTDQSFLTQDPNGTELHHNARMISGFSVSSCGDSDVEICYQGTMCGSNSNYARIARGCTISQKLKIDDVKIALDRWGRIRWLNPKHFKIDKELYLKD